MGNTVSSLSCFGQTASRDVLVYDMSPVQSKNLPLIWIVGQQNTGKKTHGELVSDQFEFEHISISELLRTEGKKTTDRGAAVDDCLKQNKRVNDDIVMQLLKEALLASKNEKGFVISNFPKNAKQADMFVKEIGPVSFVLYLYSDVVTLLNRAQARSDRDLNETVLKRDFIFATRDIKLSLNKFVIKVENINTSGLPEEVFVSVQSSFNRRLGLQLKSIDESDYSRGSDQSATSENVEVKNSETIEDNSETVSQKTSSQKDLSSKGSQTNAPAVPEVPAGDNNVTEKESEDKKLPTLVSSRNSELTYDDGSSKISQNSASGNLDDAAEKADPEETKVDQDRKDEDTADRDKTDEELDKTELAKPSEEPDVLKKETAETEEEQLESYYS